jgi:two-component system response regulator AlgR
MVNLSSKYACPSIVNNPLKVFIVDDEAPARARLRGLLDDCRESLPNVVIGEAACSRDALLMLAILEADVVLLDYDMPGQDGLDCARELARHPKSPAVVFVTAHDQHALAAFEVGALDYLLKPVRLARLEASLRRVLRSVQPVATGHVAAADSSQRHLTVNDRGRVLHVSIEDVLYLRAELKYVTLRTREREYVLTETLSQLEQDYSPVFVRIHRNCLVNRQHLMGFQLGRNDDEERWFTLLRDWPERLLVSRRQTHMVKAYRRTASTSVLNSSISSKLR